MLNAPVKSVAIRIRAPVFGRKAHTPQATIHIRAFPGENVGVPHPFAGIRCAVIDRGPLSDAPCRVGNHSIEQGQIGNKRKQDNDRYSYLNDIIGDIEQQQDENQREGEIGQVGCIALEPGFAVEIKHVENTEQDKPDCHPEEQYVGGIQPSEKGKRYHQHKAEALKKQP